jgi:hypothetical protein
LSIALIQHPLGNERAKRLILGILTPGTVGFSNHALEEMTKDDLTTADAANVLRGGVVEFAEEVRGLGGNRSWRYR